MSYKVQIPGVIISFGKDGGGVMAVPGAQMVEVYNNAQGALQGPVAPVFIIAGGDSFTTANLQTALTTMVADIIARINANPALLAQIQGFATGGT